MEPRLYNGLGQYTVSNNTVLTAEVRNATIGDTLLPWGIPFDHELPDCRLRRKQVSDGPNHSNGLF
jgi:hypothetical protein